MRYKLSWMSGCPNAWCVMLGMEIKGIRYESHRVDSNQLNEETSKYNSFDPRRNVPVLQDGGTIIYESIAILVYLEIKHPEVPLFGTNPAQTAIIWQRIFEITNNLRDPLFKGITQPIYKGRLGDIQQIAIDEMHEVLQRVNQILFKTAYLTGKTFSAADVVYMPYVQSVIRATESVDENQLNFNSFSLDKTYSNISAWLRRIAEEPGYDKAYPPHWKVTD